MKPEFYVKLYIKGPHGEMPSDELMRILEAILVYGSINAASRHLGITYSRAWEIIRKAEKMLSRPLIHTRQGTKSTVLTGEAVKLIQSYRKEKQVLDKCVESRGERRGILHYRIHVAYSNDPVLEAILDEAGLDGVSTGSLRALAMLALGNASIACSHLYISGAKNEVHFLEMLGAPRFYNIGGYWRQLSLAYNPSKISPRDHFAVLKAALRGELILALRNRGSATRVFLEELLQETMKLYGVHGDASPIKETGKVYWTHDEVAKAIASGEADAGITLTYSATLYGLPFIPLRWEKYECYTLRRDEKAGRLADILGSKKLWEHLRDLPGYSYTEPTG